MTSCEEYKAVFLGDMEPYQILSLTAPQNFTVWTERDFVWNVIFYVYSALLATVFLTVGLIATFLLIKKDCARLQSKIFFTIYTCISILSFSRALWLALDPFGLIGFISESFHRWFIISRSIETLGFPSLDVSYTLMIIALLKINTKPEEPWHHQWKIVLPVVFVIYTVIIAAVVIAFVTPYPGVISILVCQYLFAIVGMILCVLFLFAGKRLLRKLNRSETMSIRLSNTSTSELKKSPICAHNTTFVCKELQRRQAKTKRMKLKIITFTYATVIFSIIYSLISVAQAILTTHLMFGSCFGYQGEKASSLAWLILEICQRVTEVILALVLIYSITDLTVVMDNMICRKSESN